MLPGSLHTDGLIVRMEGRKTATVSNLHERSREYTCFYLYIVRRFRRFEILFPRRMENRVSRPDYYR